MERTHLFACICGTGSQSSGSGGPVPERTDAPVPASGPVHLQRRRTITEADCRDMPLIEQALLCLMAAARREPASPARLSEVGRQTVDRARAVAMIDRELFSARLTADRVCDVTGISRSSLYRLFEADNGVANYIRMRRLDALRSDLVDPRKRHQTVAQLAERVGSTTPRR